MRRADKHQAEYMRVQSELRNQKIQAMENGNFFVEPEAKLAFVVRIRGFYCVFFFCFFWYHCV